VTCTSLSVTGASTCTALFITALTLSVTGASTSSATTSPHSSCLPRRCAAGRQTKSSASLSLHTLTEVTVKTSASLSHPHRGDSRQSASSQCASSHTNSRQWASSHTNHCVPTCHSKVTFAAWRYEMKGVIERVKGVAYRQRVRGVAYRHTQDGQVRIDER